MGAEQSQPKAEGSEREAIEAENRRRRLQKSNTIAATGVYDDSPTTSEGTRPISPPLSVCYDSDLPYISYTDRPIGDSPKIRNKNQTGSRNVRSASIAVNPARKQPPTKSKQQPSSTSQHNIVVVKAGVAKEIDIDMDPDLRRLRSVPPFLPVMRGTLSLPSTREPEILERLQSVHLQNICHRMQAHYNVCATHVATEQNQIIAKVKSIDNTVTTLFATYVDMQKTYASYAEQYSKIRAVSQQLSRCNSLLNENIESLEAINNFLDIDDRLEPFVWRTEQRRK